MGYIYGNLQGGIILIFGNARIVVGDGFDGNAEVGPVPFTVRGMT